MKNQFTGNTGKVILHALAWIILIILPQYLSGRYFGNNRLFTWWFFVNTSTYLVIFYVNYLFLVPRLFFKGKRMIYFLSALVLMIGIYFLTEISNETFFRRQRNERLTALSDTSSVDTFRFEIIQTEDGRFFRNTRDSNITVGLSQNYRRSDRNQNDSDRLLMNRNDSARFIAAPGNIGSGSPPPDDERRPRPPEFTRIFRRYLPFQAYNYAVAALFFTFFSLGLKVMERHAGIEKKQKELEKEKLNSELALLKNQVSPHFFFNTLNNIYSLIAINTRNSQDAILKLSRLMRYLLYESEQGKTKLNNEIEFMNNYIDLMRLRMSDKVTLSVEFPDQYENISIPPLLFIPFIENAFKHGISYREKSTIDISLKIENEKLVFQCRNSLVKITNENNEQYSGIGLDNVVKRLNLLFPQKHKLQIDKTAETFHVFLEIDIKNLRNNDKNDHNR